ncbi:MAG: putative translation factor (SUA5) [Candidatus Atelocyanobacterium thalassa isolate SIO64986]|uniref:L-threonylcarbamoyladenylate synthase n=1 Tax=Candidatus Atelocyanobacterium thalassa isolate SIO64986 TaxID=1527444 RepID=A0A086CH24_9CHRO|nr:MAG: putative translation factor (SUA5) [Candidatus Atelocyanobacterium thalassa isolate SIO64986]
MPEVSSAELVQGLFKGKVVSFPTDTVPALATLPQNASSIFTMKKRSFKKPLILMSSSSESVWKYTQGTSSELKIWKNIAYKYWPGPLTLVLPASKFIISTNTNNLINSKTIGIRIPNCFAAQRILQKVGCLFTTSVNISGEKPAKNITEILENFPEVLVLQRQNFNNYKYSSGLPSTVVEWKLRKWEILRQGCINI